MIAIGLDVPISGRGPLVDEARKMLESVELPCCIRPAYTLGGEGGGFCATMEEFEEPSRGGASPRSRVGEILIEESLYGWKEFELEVMRDRADNVVIICSIENLDPMGVHTGDSHHRGPDADVDRPRVSANARQRHRDHAGDRCGHRGLQHSVRGRAEHRAAVRH